MGLNPPRFPWLVALALLASGCRQDMHDTPRYEPYEKSDFFPDGRSSRPQVAGTVARGQLREDTAFYTGRRGTALVSTIPIPVTVETVRRGQQRYEIYCLPCHGQLGRGDGLVVRRGYRQPSTFHIDRLRGQPDGYFYDVITNGFGAMPDYAAQIAPPDRWAVVAYVRALQLSQNATLADVPAHEQGQLGQPLAVPSPTVPRPDTGVAPADPRYGTGAAAPPGAAPGAGASPHAQEPRP